jgi:hypothetical protein
LLVVETIDERCLGEDIPKPSENEERARRLLTPYLGTLIRYDPRPDFVLCREGQVVGWVEETSATDEKSENLMARLQADGQTFRTDRLTRDWVVHFDRTMNAKRLDRQRLVDALALEEDIIARDSLSNPDPERSRDLRRQDLLDQNTARKIHDDLGVKFHLPLSRPGTGEVTLEHQSVAGFFDPSLINSVAEAKLAEKRKSLIDCDGERHLFITIEVFEPSGVALSMGGWGEPKVPDEPPSFPEWATDVWLVSKILPIRLWHCSRDDDRWELLPIT